MPAKKIQDWNSLNQQYVAALIQQLRDQLQHCLQQDLHTGSKSGKGTVHIDRAPLKAILNAMPEPPAIERLVQKLGLTNFERDILLLCTAVELDAGIADMVSRLQGGAASMQPGFGFCLSLFRDAHWSAISPSSSLRYWKLLDVQPTPSLTRSTLSIDESVLHYIAGIREMNQSLHKVAVEVPCTDLPTPSQCSRAQHIRDILLKRSTEGSLPLLQLAGSHSTEKKSFAAYISAELNSTLLSISAFAIPVDPQEQFALSQLWTREAILKNYMLYLDATDLDLNEKARVHALGNFIDQVQGVIFLDADHWTPTTKKPSILVETIKPSPEEQHALWLSVMPQAGEHEQAALHNVVAQFNLGADTIRRIGREVVQERELRDTPGNETQRIWKLCCRYSRPQIDELAQRIEPVATWDDLILPEAQKNILRDIALQVRQRNKVYRDWGFDTKGSRGLGISALFAGESGTGKTMSAEVLANELQLDLYKIDLSKVINKYIGETEKNLKRVFDAAEDGGAILLFDEADALFGKRSEVKDSHDRYSNIEVSYLLQRMEAYRGLAILTTNMKNALDKAFLRRIRFVVHFPFPDALQRAEIWSRVFPVATPKQHLDLQSLAKLTIAGGSIRNIALNAAFFAADEKKDVQMSHILRAAKSEYEKIERPFNLQEYKSML